MRYRIVFDQVLENYYVTLITWEPDGLTIQKSTKHYQIDTPTEHMADLPWLLRKLSFQVDVAQL